MQPSFSLIVIPATTAISATHPPRPGSSLARLVRHAALELQHRTRHFVAETRLALMMVHWFPRRGARGAVTHYAVPVSIASTEAAGALGGGWCCCRCCLVSAGVVPPFEAGHEGGLGGAAIAGIWVGGLSLR